LKLLLLGKDGLPGLKGEKGDVGNKTRVIKMTIQLIMVDILKVCLDH
jgi:hypothetical protein